MKFKAILVGFLAFLVTSLGFTPLLGIPAGVIVGRKMNVALGSGYEAENARWWVENFFVTGFCCGLVWVVSLVVVGGVVMLVGPVGGIVALGAIAAVVYTGIMTWRESQPPANFGTVAQASPS
jgi:hypothetical protein